MLAEYFGMRFVIPSGGSYKVTIPKQIVEKIWERRYTDIFPVCFFQIDEKLIAQDIEKMLRPKEIPGEVIEKAKQDWLEYGWRLKARKEKELASQLVEDKIRIERYRYLHARYEESFEKISEKFRQVLKDRGLHFVVIEDVEDMLSFLSEMEEEDKDEELLMVLDDVKRLKDDERSLAVLLEKLEKGCEEKKIPEDVYKRLKAIYGEKLAAARGRLEKLRAVLCS